MVTNVEARGWTGADGGELTPVQVSVAGPLPGTGTLLLAITPENGPPVCVLLNDELAVQLARGLTQGAVGDAARIG